jgi:hypothetical protein
VGARHDRLHAAVKLLAVATLYLAASLAVHRDLVRAGLRSHVYQQNMLGQDCLLHAWTIAWGQHALATAPCAVGDANIFHPERGALFYSDHLLGLALVTAPLRLVTDDALLVHNLLMVAAPALDALALFALAATLGASTPAALVGGLAYGFAPLRFAADACQIQMTAAWWLPLVLLGAYRAVRGDGRRWALLAGVALAGQGLTGIYLTTFFLPFLALAHVVWWRRHPPGASRGGWTALLAAEVTAGLVLLPTAIAYRGVQAHLGVSRSPFLNAILSLHWETVSDHVPWRTLAVLAALALVRPHALPRRLREERSLYAAIAVGAIVLGLGPAMGLPFDLGTVAGPYRILLELPGFTALRVPARMLHVALLGASVLAAGGVVALRDVGWRRPATLTLLAVAFLVGERPPATGRLLTALPPARTDAVYGWLARHPTEGAIAELPTDPSGLRTAVRQYASTIHWTPSLQGTSGVLPPIAPWMTTRLAAFPAPDVVDDLGALGVRRVVVHTRLLSPTMRADVERAAAARRLFKRRWAQEPTVVYALRPHRALHAVVGHGHPLDRGAWHVTASASPEGALRAVDADPDTGWRSWDVLDASVQRSWHDPRSILARWQAFMARAPATLTIDLGATVSVSWVRLRVGGSDPMALPELRLEGSLDGATWTRLPLAPDPDVRALVRDAAGGPMAAVLATPLPLRHLRLAVGAYDSTVRDVAVFTP